MALELRRHRCSYRSVLDLPHPRQHHLRSAQAASNGCAESDTTRSIHCGGNCFCPRALVAGCFADGVGLERHLGLVQCSRTIRDARPSRSEPRSKLPNVHYRQCPSSDVHIGSRHCMVSCRIICCCSWIASYARWHAELRLDVCNTVFGVPRDCQRLVNSELVSVSRASDKHVDLEPGAFEYSDVHSFATR